MRLKLVQLLSDKDYISGAEISKKLGVSRTAVWKHIKALKEEGYIIEAQYGRGYLLKKHTDFLTPEKIKMGLKASLLGCMILYHTEVGSTNEEVKKIAQKGYPEGTLVIAENQTMGKGRMGRMWLSSTRGISFSVLLKPPIPPAQTPQLSLMAAAALQQTLMKDFSIMTGIKWPNDLMIKGKKICGILTEMNGEIDRVNYVVLGVGINVNQSFEDFTTELQDEATSLKIVTGHEINRAILLQKYLDNLENFYLDYLEKGFSQTRDICKAESHTLNNLVSIISGDKEITGKAIDIAKDGALIVMQKSRKIACYGGEVTVV